MGAAMTSRVVVVMGVAGTGKSTVGPLVAEALGVPYAEGGRLPPRGKRRQDVRGHPAGRRRPGPPWLDAIGDWARGRAALGEGGVIGCSALKRAYRDRLRAAVPGLVFLHLTGDRLLIAARMAARKGHFMTPGCWTRSSRPWSRWKPTRPVPPWTSRRRRRSSRNGPSPHCGGCDPLTSCIRQPPSTFEERP
ncbi:hypothetical protein GCM10020000_31050 [Streptomyces olivoverticillatus]